MNALTRYRWSALLAAALLAGCSLTQPPAAGAPAGQGEVVEAEPAVAPEASALEQVHPAAAQFLADARNWLKIGNDARAAASIERAIRLDPRHPEPWLALARLRFEGGDIGQAENLALKARSLSPRDSEWFEAAEGLLVEISMLPR